MAKKHIESLLKKLPKSPGVYKLKDEEGKILYVGKAKNLNNRVRSYFRKLKGRSKRTEKLVEQVKDLEWIEVGSDWESLVLETTLIKEFRPKYNILMKDDKNFVYIKITKNEDYPRIKIVRKVLKDGAKYFGPKTSAHKCKRTLLLLQKLFKYRSCDLGLVRIGDNEVKVTKKTIAYPCLDYHIKRCAGPCIAEITPETYMESINRIDAFLGGNTEEIEKSLKIEMAKYAAEKKFEKAALLRDKLTAIHDLMEKQVVSSPDREDADVFSFVLDSGKAYFNLFMFRDGKLINQDNFIVDAPSFESGDEDNAPEVVESFLYQYYDKATDIPSSIITPIGFEESDFFEEWLKQQEDHAIHLHVPQRGEKKKLLELSKINAESFMKQHKARWAGFDEKDENAVEDLQKVLKMDKRPKRMECYDISHLAGTDTVASMVVFENGIPKKSDYRKFRLRTIKDGEVDDFKSMKEVLNRRLRYLSKGPSDVKIRKANKSKEKDIKRLFNEWRGVEEMDGEIGEYFLASISKKVIGMIRMREGKQSLFLLKSLFVTKILRKKGIATALLKHAIKINKANRVYLSCEKKMQNFYESFGFEIIKIFPKEFIADYERFIESKPKLEIILMAYEPYKNKDASFDTKPDLIVIDGGKGQLSSALKSRDDLGLDIKIIALAKRNEDIYLPGQSKALLIPLESPASKLLQRIRNESHRFAISFQKKSRKKHLTSSSLDHIKGLGDVGKLKLLQYFGSVEKIKAASEDEVATVVGVKMAKKLLQEFSR